MLSKDMPLWKPTQETITQSQMHEFLTSINRYHAKQIHDYFSLHRWSIENPEDFWQAIWEFCEIEGNQSTGPVMVKGTNMQDTKWFPDATLNFAQNLLKRQDDHIALYFAAENGDHRKITYHELYREVARIVHYLQQLGIEPGDRVVAYLPNIPETIIVMLAASSIGAVFSSCSTDFGLAGVIDRFSQIEPKVLFTVDGHFYNGKQYSHLQTIAALQKQLPTLYQTVLIPYVNENLKIDKLKQTIYYQDIPDQQKHSIDFTQVPFNHPLYILYSSGTTGKPKCIVHGVGGTLIQHMKELKLHCDLHSSDTIFFFTTCGWMMWNWLVSSLAVGASVVIYDGAPFHPKPESLIHLIDEFDITHFGVGAKLIEMFSKNNLKPIKTHQLKNLRFILTTGSPLLPKSFDYIYQNMKKDVCVASITGGTDIISLFGAPNPILPVYRGEIQCIGLGMDVKVYNDNGESVIQEQGELVCASPFPSMPIYFWNDRDGEKYYQAYFDKYPNVWAHGDYAEITQHGGLIIYGRSDATLNPGGVRIGTAEIYNQVETIKEIKDCLAIGQQWNESERIILFVTLTDDLTLTNAIRDKIKSLIRKNASPRHVPAKIIQVPDLPKTLSGKLVELAVKKIIHGQPVKNITALANPESLEYFKDIPELNSD